MPKDDRDVQLRRLRDVLERARREGRTMTYLQAADAIDVCPPQRIHQLARLVEILLKEDIGAGRTPLAALVVSRARAGLPAPGFFERARRLGIFDGDNPRRFHQRLLESLFDASGTRE